MTQLQRFNPLRFAWVALLLAVLTAPVLLFAAYLPAWAPMAAVVVLALVVLLRMLAQRCLGGHTPVDTALLLLLLLPVGLWASADRAVTLPRTYAFVANLALFWALALQREARWLRGSGWALLLGGLALGAITLLGTQFGATKFLFIQRGVYSLLPGGLRPFWNPAGFNANLTGGLLALFIPPAVMMALMGRGWGQRLLAALTAAALLFITVLAQTRGALLGLAVALPLITHLAHSRWRWFWWLTAASAGIALALGVGNLSLDTVLGQNEALGSSSIQGRVELWSRALYMTQDFSFTGVGLGMFQRVMQLLYPTFTIAPDADIRHPHNLYLQASAEMGIPGLIAHLAIYITLAWLLLRTVRGVQHWGAQGQDQSPPGRANLARPGREHGSDWRRMLALGLLGTLVVYLVHGLVDVVTYAPRAAIFIWGLFGLMAAVTTGQDKPQTPAQD